MALVCSPTRLLAAWKDDSAFLSPAAEPGEGATGRSGVVSVNEAPGMRAGRPLTPVGLGGS